ncbi:MAG: tetratricopeptide repeat protein [Treponema sp.]|nr:tetratricopeptide repeat protein [Treponema sp.]
MPGLNQLKQFNTDILNVGDEVKIRSARSEKPVRVPIPKDITVADDSAEFLEGLPQLSEADIAQADAAAAERESAAHDFSDITGESAAKAKAPAAPVAEKMPDVSDLLSANQGMDLSDLDLSDFEEPAEPEPAPEPEPTPIEDLDLESLLQIGSTPATEEEEAPAQEERYVPAAVKAGKAAQAQEEVPDVPLDDDFDVRSLLGPDEGGIPAAEPEPPADTHKEEFEKKLDSLAAAPAQDNPAPAFDMDAAEMDFKGTESGIDLNDDMPPEFNETPDPSALPSEEAAAPGSAASEDLGLDSFDIDAAAAEPAGGEGTDDAGSEAPGAAALEGMGLDDFNIDDVAAAPGGDGDVPAAGDETVADEGDMPAMGDDLGLGSFDIDAVAAGNDAGADGADSSSDAAAGTEGTGLEDFNIDDVLDTPAADGGDGAMPAADETIVDSGDAPAADDSGSVASDDLGLGDFDIDALAGNDAGDAAGEPGAADAAAPEATGLEGLDIDTMLDSSGTDDGAAAAGNGADDAAADKMAAGDMPDASAMDFGGTEPDAGTDGDAGAASEAVEQFDTSGMDGVDFSGGDSGFELGTITSTEGEDDFAIPGFSDTVTANLNKKEPVAAMPGAAPGETIDANADKPKNTFTDAEYKRFLENLEHYPLNVRIALEDFVAKNEFTDDAVFEVLEKVLRKAPARQVAAELEKKLDVSLQVPRDFERRSAEEYAAYKKTVEYQLKNRIIPFAILSTVAAALLFCIFVLTKNFIVYPLRASRLYKQGYALIQEQQYPQSEDNFNKALTYRTVKKWFYKYADSYREHKQYDRARAMYSRILKQFNHEKSAGLTWADMEANDLYNYEEAERILKREVLDYHINDPDGILKLGDLYLDWATDKDVSKYPLAKEQYDLLVSLYPKSKQLDKYMARQMRYFIRTDNLLQVLQYKQMFYPDKKKALESDDMVELSGYLLDKRYGNLRPSEENLRKNIEDVRNMLEDAVKGAPGNPVALYNMGRYFVKTNSGTKAKSYFKAAIETFKGMRYRSRHNTYRYIDTYRLLGEEYSAEREYMLAEQTYGVGIDLFEKEHESSGFEPTEDIGKLYADMGDIDYFISGKMDVALGSYIKSVESKNDTPSVRYRIGFIQYTKKNFAEALGSFIKSHEGAPDDTHVLLALANTHSLRDDNLAAQAYYTELLDILDNQRRLYGVMLPQVRADQGDLVDTYMKASNNLGVTLSRLANQTGNSKLNAESIVRLQDSLRAYDALTRNQETMVRLEGSNLAAQNIKYITEPISEFDPGIYTQIPRIINDEEGLE